MSKALYQGPWFVAGSFLSVKRWEPNFVPKAVIVSHTAIWTRLPQFPTEFYDKSILEKNWQKIGPITEN